MLRRTLPTLLSLLLGLVTTAAPAQERPPPVSRPDLASLERRLGEVEKQLGLLLQEVKSLREELRPPAVPPLTARAEVKIFVLRNTAPSPVVKVLQDLLQGRDGRALVITADQRTNSVLVRGHPEHLQLIEALIARLDEPVGKKGGDRRR
jgi:type II secretory pathway component GspD/PulD (secretin)